MDAGGLRRGALVAALVLGVVFRVVGAVVNTEANDDHMEVIRVIAHERRMPAATEFWESFQPPLYHATAAAVLAAFPPLAAVREVQVAQGLSCLAGLAALAILLTVIRALPVSPDTKALVGSLVSLNPALISTSIQATNDAFVILFATLALAGGSWFFRRVGARPFVVMTTGVVLACVSKGNGLVLAVAVALTFGLALVAASTRTVRLAMFCALALVVWAATIPVAGGYLSRRAEMGSAFATNMAISPPPALLSHTTDKRPGITSVASGFFTFRILSMLADPLIEGPQQDDGYPRHRTSMWSLIYGGAHSVHYAYFPRSWRVDTTLAEWIVRGVAVLALLPTTMLACGLLLGIVRITQSIINATSSAVRSGDVLFALTAAGYFAFVAVYGYRYRDFSTMKGIFVCPAALAFTVFLSQALERPGGRVWTGLTRAARASAAALCVAYAADVGVLLWWLLRVN